MKELIHDENLQMMVRQKIFNDQVIWRSWQWQENKPMMLVLVKQTRQIVLLKLGMMLIKVLNRDTLKQLYQSFIK